MKEKLANIDRLNKILVIDDEPGTLLHLKTLLSPYSNQIIANLNPLNALNQIDESLDLIITDLIMPELSGNELVSIIRRNSGLSRIPIIVLTAKDRNDDEISGLFEMGVNDYLSKPFLEEELISRIKLQIRMRNLVEDLNEANKKLKEELEKNKKTNFITLQYASLIENELLEKIDKLSAKVNSQQISHVITKLRSQLAFIRDDKNKLMRENARFKYELDKINRIHSVVVLHDQAIEEDMTLKLDEVSTKANTDYLTRVYNRVKFYELLYFEIDKSKKGKRSLSIIMFDIDYFKKVNDTYGHDAGDMVLVRLSEIVKNVITGNEIFARWGGEEFLILLPGKNLDESALIAEQIRMSVNCCDFDPVEKITCSFGVTEYQETDDEALFLKRVDNALYCAKNNGRNRVEILRKGDHITENIPGDNLG